MTQERSIPSAQALDQISVLILTFNEEPNIGRSLAALARFTDVVVLDSGSTDRTREIVGRFRNTRLVTRSFDRHSAQWNYGIQGCGIVRPWVLALDADYLLPTEVIDEIAQLKPDPEVVGYELAFRYCIGGRRLSGTLYPAKVVLFRRAGAHFVQEGHTQRLVIQGQVVKLAAHGDHDDRKDFSRWLASQQHYAKLEVEYLFAHPKGSLRLVDKIRLTGVLAPFFVFVFTLFAKRCILDGWPGWFYVLQRLLAEVIIAAEVVNRKVSRRRPGTENSEN